MAIDEQLGGNEYELGIFDDELGAKGNEFCPYESSLEPAVEGLRVSASLLDAADVAGEQGLKTQKAFCTSFLSSVSKYFLRPYL